MKTIFVAAAVLILIGCNQAVTETETLLVCEGNATSLVQWERGKKRYAFTLTKTNGKVTKVKSEYHTFIPEKTAITTKDETIPRYTQLIVEADRIVLRYHFPESKQPVSDFKILNTGSYQKDLEFGEDKGQCTISTKAF